MKIFKRSIILVSVLLIACQKGTKTEVDEFSKVRVGYLSEQRETIENSKLYKEITNLNGSIWTNTPMKEFPNCIDSLKFEESKVYIYSCENEHGERHGYKIKGDTIYVEKWDFINQADSMAQLASKEWYKLTLKGLVWVKVIRKRGDYWDDIDNQYLNKFYYKKVN